MSLPFGRRKGEDESRIRTTRRMRKAAAKM
jgi:hypothetical protein